MTALRLSRFHSAQATTAAMLCLAGQGELPSRPANAIMMAENHLSDTDTDTDTWAHLWAQAGEAPTGRPARHCSPTCRTRAWRRDDETTRTPATSQASKHCKQTQPDIVRPQRTQSPGQRDGQQLSSTASPSTHRGTSRKQRHTWKLHHSMGLDLNADTFRAAKHHMQICPGSVLKLRPAGEQPSLLRLGFALRRACPRQGPAESATPPRVARDPTA
jgi:hypothetical protein